MSTPHEGLATSARDPGGIPPQGRPGLLTRGGEAAAAAAVRLVRRHKTASAVAACCAVALIAVSAVTGGGTPAHTDLPAPGFSLAVLGQPGQRISLSQYAGKPLIVNFWASWCAPCQRETPLLARFHRAEGGRVIIVGLDENDAAGSALKFARAKGVTYPLAFDPQTTAAGAYGVVALPQTFFLDARHRIVDRVFGAVTTAQLTTGVRLMNSDRG
ncbi:MAG: TlpA family protein disulfide reductase [Streptosporangiaceae bacterium]|nr:TlpA family protein disulfide reductase [Streptosporangiaceae bacterium]MBV9856730.1 TlpA family protein disulfide reductase [Streptosporangiaceae bacterium]